MGGRQPSLRPALILGSNCDSPFASSWLTNQTFLKDSMEPSYASCLVTAAAMLSASAPGLSPAHAASPQIRYSNALQHKAVDLGQTNQFRVSATSEGLLYQWRLNGDILPAQTNQTLSIGPAEPGDEGESHSRRTCRLTGLLLLFGSIRPGGQGDEDIWVATQTTPSALRSTSTTIAAKA